MSQWHPYDSSPILDTINKLGALKDGLYNDDSLSVGRSLRKSFHDTNSFRMARFDAVYYSAYRIDCELQDHKEAKNESKGKCPLVHDLELLLSAKLSNKGIYSVAHLKDYWCFWIDTTGQNISVFEQDEFLSLIHSSTISVKRITLGMFTSNDIFQNPSSSKLINNIYINFLRALKKHLIKLFADNCPVKNSSSKVFPFSTHLLLQTDNFNYFNVLRLDLMINHKNEVLVSTTVAENPRFYNLASRENLETTVQKSSYAIYLCPSGIRCNFAVNGCLKDSITSDPPKDYERLLQLLKKYSNIFIDEKNTRWVKVVPNVNHLNNLSPHISSFLEDSHTGDGSTSLRFIAWPLSLCFVQYGVNIDGTIPPSSQYDPFKLLDQRISYIKEQQNHGVEEAIEELQDFCLPPEEDNIKGVKDSISPALEATCPSPIVEVDISDAYFDGVLDDVMNEEISLPKSEWNELFGEEAEENEIASPNGESFVMNSKEPVKLPTTTNPFYEDPGAPEPAPLPIISEISPCVHKASSVFSPLRFNPVIHDNIDIKYSTGGKFYVDRSESPSGPHKDSLTNAKLFLKAPTTGVGISGNSWTREEDSDLESDSDDDQDRLLKEEEEEEEGEEEEEYKNEKYQDQRDLRQKEEEKKENDETKIQEDFYQVMKSSEGDEASPQADFDMIDGSDHNEGRKLEVERNTVARNSRIHIRECNNSALTTIPIPSGGSNDTMDNLSQNWVPFIMRTVPLYSIPVCFLYKAPSLSKDRLNQELPIILKAILFDLPGSFSNKCRHDHQVQSKVDKLVRDVLPGIEKLSLLDFVGPGRISDGLFNIVNRENCPSTTSIEYDSRDSVSNEAFLGSPSLPTTQDGFIEKMLPNDTNLLIHTTPTMINVKRSDEDLNVGITSAKFWKSLGLQPLEGPNNFQAIAIVPDFGPQFLDQATDFIGNLQEEYKTNKLGEMSLIEIANDSVLRIAPNEQEKSYWKNVHDTLQSHLNDICNRLKPEMPLLIIFINPFTSLVSVIETSQVLRELRDSISRLLNLNFSSESKKRKKKSTNGPNANYRKGSEIKNISISQKSIPLNAFFLIDGSYCVPSQKVLTRISLQLYCLVTSGHFTNNIALIAQEIPSAINFKLTKVPIARQLIIDDLYIHLAYDRATDKSWCAACWTDQYGGLREVKAWYSERRKFLNGGANLMKSFEEISNDIWSITMEYIKCHPGKSYLILTRLNNIIPDDELIQWKRLSLLNKSIYLVVLTVDLEPTLKLSGVSRESEGSGGVNNVMTTTMYPDSTAGIYPNTAESLGSRFDSPDISSNMFQTPSSPAFNTSGNIYSESDGTIVNISEELLGLVLSMPVPLSNQINRVPIRTGYLIQTANLTEGKSILEVNLLSCPAFIDPVDLMKKILCQYRNLADLKNFWYASIVDERCNPFPWHILTVSKILKELVHVRVDE
ncbi:hypothetical protein LJB42_004169 [Komagataella kurtzmanii]|nr:hypothetical protein LJB42_004169 [Komagataella kurtzmanii]